MKKYLLFVVPMLAFTTPAAAQMAVFDVKSYAEIAKQLKTAQDTYNQAVQTYQQVSGITQIKDVSSLLNNPATKTILPPDMQNIQQVYNSSGQLSSAAANIRNGRKVELPGLSSSATAGDKATRASIEASGNLAATNAAIAEAGYASTAMHTTGLDQLQTALEQATTQKDREAITARIGIEQARISNQSVQLQALKMRQDAEEQLRGQQMRETYIAGIDADTGAKEQ